jgi:hypothetical protein
MDRKCLIYLAAGVVLLVIALYWTRFQIIPVHAMNGVGFYKLNRLTGQVTLVTGLEQINILKVRDFEAPQATVEPPAPSKPER